jgi:uncharacterized protein (DUF4415 family)
MKKNFRANAIKPRTPAQLRHLERRAARAEKRIDYSDIPPITPDRFVLVPENEKLVNMVALPAPHSGQSRVNLLLDSDVSEWVRKVGAEKLNSLLRAAMKLVS